MRYEKIKFLVIALKNGVEVYAWAPKPYHKFMAFKVGNPWQHLATHARTNRKYQVGFISHFPKSGVFFIWPPASFVFHLPPYVLIQYLGHDTVTDDKSNRVRVKLCPVLSSCVA